MVVGHGAFHDGSVPVVRHRQERRETRRRNDDRGTGCGQVLQAEVEHAHDVGHRHHTGWLDVPSPSAGGPIQEGACHRIHGAGVRQPQVAPTDVVDQHVGDHRGGSKSISASPALSRVGPADHSRSRARRAAVGRQGQRRSPRLVPQEAPRDERRSASGSLTHEEEFVYGTPILRIRPYEGACAGPGRLLRLGWRDDDGSDGECHMAGRREPAPLIFGSCTAWSP